MKAQFENMPPLGPGESPWADHEVQMRSAMHASEVTPPAGLEHRIWEALDAQAPASKAPSISPWVAAAVAGGVLIGAFWMASDDAAEGTPNPIRTEIGTTIEDEQQSFENQAIGLPPSIGSDDKIEGLDEALEESQLSLSQEGKVPERGEMEVMKGIESATIPAEIDANRNPIQTSKSTADTVRLTGTLKLKQ